MAGNGAPDLKTVYYFTYGFANRAPWFYVIMAGNGAPDLKTVYYFTYGFANRAPWFDVIMAGNGAPDLKTVYHFTYGFANRAPHSVVSFARVDWSDRLAVRWKTKSLRHAARPAKQ